MSMVIPSWYAWAGNELGVTEVAGSKHNRRIVDYWSMGRVQLDVNDDDTPWCAAFINAALESNGFPGSRSGRARSFADGPLFKPCDNRLGAIVVLSSDRGAASGHVGLLAGIGDRRVLLRGGNQGNRVCDAPFAIEKIVATLWPVGALPYTKYPLAPRVDASGKLVSDA